MIASVATSPRPQNDKNRKQNPADRIAGELTGYGVAVAATAIVFAVRVLLSPLLGADAPLLAFLLSILVASWWGGFGPGLLATTLALILGRLYLIEPRHTLALTGVNASEIIRIFLFVLIGVLISRIVHSRRRALQEISAAVERQRRFLREVLLVTTEGRLHLCDTAEDLPPAPPPTAHSPAYLVLSPETLREVRHLTLAAGQEAGLSETKLYDLLSGVGEAAMNAVVHAHSGEASIHADPIRGLVQVRIKDSGGGIAEGALHRATLERGYSSAGTLGHGFWMMIHTCDRIFLLTGANGTTLILEQSQTERPEDGSGWLAGLQTNAS